MRSLKQFIAKQIFKFAGVYRRPTMTEEAFHALHTLDKMRQYIQEEEPSDCWPAVSDGLIMKYRITSHLNIWGVLERAKENKLI